MHYFQNLVAQSLSRTREATLSMLGLNDPGLRAHVGQQMNDELGSEGCFLAPPVFEHTFGWEEADCTFADLADGLFSRKLLNTLANAPESYCFPPTRHPYRHQMTAWNTLLDEAPQSVVITCGTGSGKTECFMLPILEDLIREQAQQQQPLVGVRALFLYPLNALINSQQERLDAWTASFGKDIRYCLYNGKTEESEYQVRGSQKTRPNQILSRQLLRKEPAPILMTNATMLEYMLVRQVDNPILQISCEQQSLRWIVLDEAHTYVGSQAAELSLLLRRVVLAFGKRAEEIRFIATSATIAGKEAKAQLQSYLANLAGVDSARVVVIDGHRVIPEIYSDQLPCHLSLAEICDMPASGKDPGVSPQRFAALVNSPMALRLRHAIVDREKPCDLNELVTLVAQYLDGHNQAQRQQQVLQWIDCMTGTKATAKGEPFLKLRAHFFQRMLHGLWACVDPQCAGKTEQLDNWPFGNVYVTQRTRCECQAPVYEIGFCHDCKTPHLLAEDNNGVLQQCSPYAGDEFSLHYEAAEEDLPDTQQTSRYKPGMSGKVILAGAGKHLDEYTEQTLALDSLKLERVQGGRELTVRLLQNSDAACAECQPDDKSGRDFLQKSYLGAPFYVANVVPTILEYCPDPDKADCDGGSPESLPGRGRKLITFTDSRQGTARMAVRMQQEAERSTLRGRVFEVLRNASIKFGAAPKDAPTGNYDELITQAKGLDSLGMADMAQKLRLQAESIKTGSHTEPVFEVAWYEMLTELAGSKDISQSILDYNRYANPELIDRQKGGVTMARLLLAREYARRPKNQNSTETLGIVRVGYKGLASIKIPPDYWGQINGRLPGDIGQCAELTPSDWQDFIKVALDFYVRENTFIQLDPTMQRWMGGRFFSKKLYPPKSDIIESSSDKMWPQVKPKGVAHRLVKLLAMGAGLDRTKPAHKDIIDSWLVAAWGALVKSNIIEPFENSYTLNLNTLTFSLPRTAWVCPLTNRLIDTTFRGLTPYLPKTPGERSYLCRKISLPTYTGLRPMGGVTSQVSQIRSAIAGDASIAGLRSENLWTDISDRTVEGGFYYRTAEHSAQQSSGKLEKYEELFKKGKINVLNCSTTMEMGVDIGNVSAVVMNNAPPHPANYLQRAGRGGRRSESRAIAYTLCKADPHNQRIFAQPKWPFETVIPAPTITLSSDRIVQRHVNSQLLAMFLHNEALQSDDNTKLTVQWFYCAQGQAPYQRFVAWLSSQPENVAGSIAAIVAGTGLAGTMPMVIIDNSLTTLRDIAERWQDEQQGLLKKVQQAADEPYKKALMFELKRHEGEYLLRDLAARAFLPGYGFPTNVVNLNTYNVEDFVNKQRKKEDKRREDNIFSLKEQPTRGLDVAIREYAPGAQIVIDGRVHQSAGVGLHWHSGGAVKEAQKFDIAWRCANCGATGYKENALNNSGQMNCTHCDADLPFAVRKRVLRPAGFVCDFYQASSNDVSSQKYIRVERPRIQLEAGSLGLPDNRCGYMRFGHEGHVFYHSSGEHGKGYAICLACGRADSMTAQGKRAATLFPDKLHRPVGGKVGSHKAEDCSGESVKESIYLGYQSQTDVFELFLKNPQNGEWLSDRPEDQIIAVTIAVALRDVIGETLGIASTEMGFGYRLDKDISSGMGRSVVQLFDQVSGGAGFVLAEIKNIVGLLKEVYGKLECPVNCENICSRCLANKDSRVELEQLDRKAARQWLSQSAFLDHLILPAAFRHIAGAEYCAYGPKRFISDAINNKKATAINLVLRGEPLDWDLSESTFRAKILTWHIVGKLAVRIGIMPDTVLDEATKYSLTLLARLGIEIVNIETVNIEFTATFADPTVIVQLEAHKQIYTLLSDQPDASIPGESWLHSDEASLWVSSDRLPVMKMHNIDVDGWDKVAPAHQLVEVKTALNGPLSDLPARFKSLLADNSPELIQRLENDQAISLRYSDRYLRSPWTLMLLEGFLSVFSGHLTGAEFNLVAVGRNEKRPQIIDHDWPKAEAQKQVLSGWLERVLAVKPTVMLAQKTYEVSHGRVLTIEWASGRCSKIIFDQGMGYWRPQMPNRTDRAFDFDLSAAMQLAQMKHKASAASMLNAASWPTFITIVNE